MKKIKGMFLGILAVLAIVAFLHFSLKPQVFGGGNNHIDPIPMPFTATVEVLK